MTVEATLPPRLHDSGAALLRRFGLARAAALARAGQYDAAAELITAEPPSTASELDLLARIRAQQGRLAEAKELWIEAQQLMPDDERIAAALRRVRRVRRGRTLVRNVLTVATVIASFALGLLLRGLAPQRQVAQTTTPPKASPAPRPVRAPITLDLPGLRTQREQATLAVAFDQPFFSSGARLTPAARQSLALVAHRLQPRADDIRVVVCGHADDVPLTRRSRYRSNDDLALARASAAVRQLVAAGLPAALFSVRSAVDANEPRTVVLHITETEPAHGQ